MRLATTPPTPTQSPKRQALYRQEIASQPWMDTLDDLAAGWGRMGQIHPHPIEPQPINPYQTRPTPLPWLTANPMPPKSPQNMVQQGFDRSAKLWLNYLEQKLEHSNLCHFEQSIPYPPPEITSLNTPFLPQKVCATYARLASSLQSILHQIKQEGHPGQAMEQWLNHWQKRQRVVHQQLMQAGQEARSHWHLLSQLQYTVQSWRHYLIHLISTHPQSSDNPPTHYLLPLADCFHLENLCSHLDNTCQLWWQTYQQPHHPLWVHCQHARLIQQALQTVQHTLDMNILDERSPSPKSLPMPVEDRESRCA